jgi:hypothetical protein
MGAVRQTSSENLAERTAHGTPAMVTELLAPVVEKPEPESVTSVEPVMEPTAGRMALTSG